MPSPLEGSIRRGRLRGDRPQEEHRALYAELFGNVEVAASLWPDTLGGPRTSAQAVEMLAADIDHWTRVGFGPWVFSENNTGGFVGRGGLQHTDIAGKPSVEVAYAVCHDAWGKGYATEIATVSIEHARSLRLAEVVGFTLTTNTASQRVLEKAGLSFEGVIEHVGLPHWFGRVQLR